MIACTNVLARIRPDTNRIGSPAPTVWADVIAGGGKDWRSKAHVPELAAST